MGTLTRPPEKPSSAVGLLVTDAKLAKVPLTVLSFEDQARDMADMIEARLRAEEIT